MDFWLLFYCCLLLQPCFVALVVIALGACRLVCNNPTGSLCTCSTLGLCCDTSKYVRRLQTM